MKKSPTTSTPNHDIDPEVKKRFDIAEKIEKQGRFVRTGVAAKIAGCSQQKIIKLFDAGSIKGRYIIGSTFRLVNLASLEEFSKKFNPDTEPYPFYRNILITKDPALEKMYPESRAYKTIEELSGELRRLCTKLLRIDTATVDGTPKKLKTMIQRITEAIQYPEPEIVFLRTSMMQEAHNTPLAHEQEEDPANANGVIATIDANVSRELLTTLKEVDVPSVA